MTIFYWNCSRSYNSTYRSIITNKYLFGVTFMHSRKDGLILSHMIRCSRINEPFNWSRRRRCSIRVTRSTKYMSMRVDSKDESRLMWCFFIVASKAAIFLKHLDSSWLYFPQKLQWRSVFFPFGLDPLSFLKEGVDWEGLGPFLFRLLLQKLCFFEGLDFLSVGTIKLSQMYLHC